VITKVNRSAGAVRSVTVLGHFAATIAVEDIADYRAPADGVAEKVKAATKLAPMCNYPSEGFRHMTRAEWERKKMSDVPQVIRHKANEKHGAHRTRATSVEAGRRFRFPDRRETGGPSRAERTGAGAADRNPAARAQHASSPADGRSGCRGLRGSQGHAQGWREGRRGAAVVPHAARSAARMVELAGIEAGDRVLEPERWHGELGEGDPQRRPGRPSRSHRDRSELCSILKASGFEVSCRDFLAASMPVCPDSEGGHDCVLMNPHFPRARTSPTSSTPSRSWKPGGRLVAICATAPPAGGAEAPGRDLGGAA